MPQQISPFLEGKYGWSYGESGWNSGMDENLNKFSFLFDGNVDAITSSLPAVVNGNSYFLTTDNRFYFGVGGVYYSSPCPDNFIFKIKSTGSFYQFNGTSTVQINTPAEVDSRLDAVELTISTLGTAAFEDVVNLATQADLDVTSAQANAYTDTLRADLSATSGTTLIGHTGSTVTSTVATVLNATIKQSLHPSMFGISPGGDVTSLLNSNQNTFDLKGDSYIVSAGVVRTGSLFNGTITYSGGSTGTFNNAIVGFTTTEDMTAEGLRVIYSGVTSGVRGISAYGSAHRINLRNTYVEGTTDQGIRVQGLNDPDLTKSRVYNCMKDAIGSSDPNLAYGAIAIFGSSDICNRAKLVNCIVDTQSTGISIVSGSGHVIEGCSINVIDPLTVSPVSMGIYCIDALTNLRIKGNTVGQFANEGIDVHNTGAPVNGIRGIFIENNLVQRASYYGISVVSDPSFKINDCLISGNVVINQSAAYTFGFSGGIIVDGVINATIQDNNVISSGQTSTPSSYGLSVDQCNYVTVKNNYYSGSWDFYERYTGYNSLTVEGVHGVSVPVGKTGILLTQNVVGAVTHLRNIKLAGTDATSIVLDQGGTSLAYSFFVMQGCYLNGQVNINADSGNISDNYFRNLSGTITTATGVSASNNPGWQSSQTGTTKTTPSTVNRWIPIREDGTTYYIPAYTSKTT